MEMQGFSISMRFEWMHRRDEWKDRENRREINQGNSFSFLPIICYMNNNNNINKKKRDIYVNSYLLMQRTLNRLFLKLHLCFFSTYSLSSLSFAISIKQFLQDIPSNDRVVLQCKRRGRKLQQARNYRVISTN